MSAGEKFYPSGLGGRKIRNCPWAVANFWAGGKTSLPRVKRRYVYRIFGQEEKPILPAWQAANSGSLATRNCDLDFTGAFF